MTINARLECGCRIWATGSRRSAFINHAADTGNIITSRKALRAGKKGFGYRLISALFGKNRLYSPFYGRQPAEGCGQEWGPVSADAQGAMADKKAGTPNRAEGGRKMQNQGVFSAGKVNSSAFARLCPPCSPLPAFLWGGRFLSRRSGSDRMQASNGVWPSPAAATWKNLTNGTSGTIGYLTWLCPRTVTLGNGSPRKRLENIHAGTKLGCVRVSVCRAFILACALQKSFNEKRSISRFGA
jgi:hypothetical protein